MGLPLNRPYVYGSFGQEDPYVKSRSLVAEMTLIVPAARLALEGNQIQPILIELKLISR